MKTPLFFLMIFVSFPSLYAMEPQPESYLRANTTQFLIEMSNKGIMTRRVVDGTLAITIDSMQDLKGFIKSKLPVTMKVPEGQEVNAFNTLVILAPKLSINNQPFLQEKVAPRSWPCLLQ